MSDWRLQELKGYNSQWFARGNKRFFGDVSYRVLVGQKTGNWFLVRSTYGWSDMFDGKKKLSYRVNPVINESEAGTLKIGALLDETFSDIYQVKDYLKEK